MEYKRIKSLNFSKEVFNFIDRFCDSREASRFVDNLIRKNCLNMEFLDSEIKEHQDKINKLNELKQELISKENPEINFSDDELKSLKLEIRVKQKATAQDMYLYFKNITNKEIQFESFERLFNKIKSEVYT
jgi:hypothetical protein